MEKRRRERINRSLNDLKSILLEALRRDVSKDCFWRIREFFAKNFWAQIGRFSVDISEILDNFGDDIRVSWVDKIARA